MNNCFFISEGAFTFKLRVQELLLEGFCNWR